MAYGSIVRVIGITLVNTVFARLADHVALPPDLGFVIEAVIAKMSIRRALLNTHQRTADYTAGSLHLCQSIHL